MVGVGAPVENDLLDLGRLEALAQHRAEQAAGVLVLGALGLGPELLLQGRRGQEDGALPVVDDLGVDVGVALEHVETGPLGRALDPLADPLPETVVPDLPLGCLVFKHRSLPPFVLS